MFLSLLLCFSLSYDCTNCQAYSIDIVKKFASGWSKDEIQKYYETKFKPLPKPLRPKYIKKLIEEIQEDVKDHKITVPLIVCVQLKQCSIMANKLSDRRALRPKIMPKLHHAQVQQ